MSSRLHSPSSPAAGTSKARLTASERRASILEAALKLFSERGFRGTTTRELAQAVGVTEPVLYEHFKTKSELYAALIDAKSREGLEELVSRRDSFLAKGDDRGFFTLIANIILDFHEQDPAYLRLMLYSALENHELKQLLFERQNAVFLGVIQQYLEARMDAGKLRRINPRIVAQSLTGMVAQYSMSRVLFQCGDNLPERQEAVDGMIGILLHGLIVNEDSHA